MEQPSTASSQTASGGGGAGHQTPLDSYLMILTAVLFSHHLIVERSCTAHAPVRRYAFWGCLYFIGRRRSVSQVSRILLRPLQLWDWWEHNSTWPQTNNRWRAYFVFWDTTNSILWCYHKFNLIGDVSDIKVKRVFSEYDEFIKHVKKASVDRPSQSILSQKIDFLRKWIC